MYALEDGKRGQLPRRFECFAAQEIPAGEIRDRDRLPIAVILEEKLGPEMRTPEGIGAHRTLANRARTRGNWRNLKVIWGRLSRGPVTPEVASSSLVGPAIFIKISAISWAFSFSQQFEPSSRAVRNGPSGAVRWYPSR